MIRGRTTVVCSASVFLWQTENSSWSPSDSWNTLKPDWNLWQKLLFLLAFENHLLFLGLGHLVFRLMVKHFVWELLDATRNTECSALARSRNIAYVTWAERGGAGGGGGGEREGENGISREEYSILISSSKMPANYYLFVAAKPSLFSFLQCTWIELEPLAIIVKLLMQFSVGKCFNNNKNNNNNNNNRIIINVASADIWNMCLYAFILRAFYGHWFSRH